jgi:DHA1 family multidrug resistance protein-like MFS transporter
MYMGNVIGPLIGSSVSAVLGFRWVFVFTALMVTINTLQLWAGLRRVRADANNAKEQAQ